MNVIRNQTNKKYPPRNMPKKYIFILEKRKWILWLTEEKKRGEYLDLKKKNIACISVKGKKKKKTKNMACFSSKQQMLPIFKPSATAAPHGGAARGKSRWRNQRHWCYQLWQNGSVYMDSTNKTDGRDHKRGIRTTPRERVSQEMTHRSKGRES